MDLLVNVSSARDIDAGVAVADVEIDAAEPKAHAEHNQIVVRRKESSVTSSNSPAPTLFIPQPEQ